MFGNAGGFFRRGLFQSSLKVSGPVDNPSEAIRHHAQQRTYAGKQKYRGNRQVNGIGDIVDVIQFTHHSLSVMRWFSYESEAAVSREPAGTFLKTLPTNPLKSRKLTF
jgi:hypothetical protein